MWGGLLRVDGTGFRDWRGWEEEDRIEMRGQERRTAGHLGAPWSD